MTTTKTVALEAITCGACGCVFGLAEVHLERLRFEGGRFFCPNGHSRGFHVSEAERLRKQLAAEKAAHDQTRAAAVAAELALTKAKARETQLRKRVGNGVCPCCNRTFTNLQRHMHTQHPEFDGTSDGGVVRRAAAIAELRKEKKP